MKELLRATDPVLIRYVDDLLRQSGIEPMILDRNMSVLEGSIGILPCRVLVAEEDLAAARRHIRDAGLEKWIIGDTK